MHTGADRSRLGQRMTLDALAARVMGDRYDTGDMAGINS